MKFLPKKRTAIGIDIGSRMIKAVQLDREEGPFQRIKAVSLIPRMHPQEAIDRQEVRHLRAILKRQGFTGRNIVLSVPDTLLLRAVLELPPGVSEESRVQMARMELSRIHQMNPQAFEMIHWGLSTQRAARAGAQNVVVACPHQAAETLLDTFEHNGFNVKALDVRAAAAARACQDLCVPPPAITAILDLGWSSTNLLLVCGRTVLYERFLKTELGRLTTQLSKKFHIDLRAAVQLVDTIGIEKERINESFDTVSVDVIHTLIRHHFRVLTDALTVPFSYANHQYAGAGVTRLLLLGGGAGVPGLEAYLASELGIEVRKVVPSDIVGGPDEVSAGAGNPAMIVALGLARFSDEE